MFSVSLKQRTHIYYVWNNQHKWIHCDVLALFCDKNVSIGFFAVLCMLNTPLCSPAGGPAHITLWWSISSPAKTSSCSWVCGTAYFNPAPRGLQCPGSPWTYPVFAPTSWSPSLAFPSFKPALFPLSLLGPFVHLSLFSNHLPISHCCVCGCIKQAL